MYKAPVADITHTILEVAGMGSDLQSGRFGDFSEDLLLAVLEEAGRLASDEIEPVVVAAESVGAKLSNGTVTMPDGWHAVWQSFVDGGWNSISSNEAYGGQGLPLTVSMAALEIWNSCSLAFGLCPTLTSGAAEAIDAHASDEIKALYLPKMIAGIWTGTMNLTEPQAGSDLGTIRTRAERSPDGNYRIFGQKIFITFGEHDLSENIVHLVLARLSDAPEGTKGISLFVVPKFIPDASGNPGARNDVFCASIEHKLGIHCSPTCVMIYGDNKGETETAGAVGWLVGEENRGLACMFTMMNNARLAVGMQGVSIAESATQKAITFARDRRQGRAVGAKGGVMSPIIEHPDVQRMLMTMKSQTQAARAICYACAVAIDRSHAADGVDASFWADRAAFLTPLAKAFATDVGMEVASLGVQVHGGMGFVEETGAARFMRDARIAPIYEGTNGIQAIDLVMRKLPLGAGGHTQGFIKEMREIVADVRKSNRPEFGTTADRLERALDDALAATDFLQLKLAKGEANHALAGATPYLRLMSLAAGGAWLAKGALGGDAARTAICRFFAENQLAETAALNDRIITGADSLLDASQILFNSH
ncbi:MAG: acyl-CoA dehydrogenase [Rhizobiaceae bacterium]